MLLFSKMQSYYWLVLLSFAASLLCHAAAKHHDDKWREYKVRYS